MLWMLRFYLLELVKISEVDNFLFGLIAKKTITKESQILYSFEKGDWVKWLIKGNGYRTGRVIRKNLDGSVNVRMSLRSWLKRGIDYLVKNRLFLMNFSFNKFFTSDEVGSLEFDINNVSKWSKKQIDFFSERN